MASIIDVGASNGQWSLVARHFWPQARVHLVEALAHWQQALIEVCGQQTGFSHVLAAAGSEDAGELSFGNVSDTDDPYAGAVGVAGQAGSWQVPQVTLAGEAKRAGLKPPYLIKLDTGGFELPILAGAAPLLPDTSLAVIEVYNFHTNPHGVLFHEICQLMSEKGFRTVDLSDPLWRSHDNSLWQFDLFFVRADRPEFKFSGY